MPFQPMQQQPVGQAGGMEPPPAEQAEQMFKEQFYQTAYSVLFSKFPDLAPNVVTFKVLETDPDEGKGVGSFIIMAGEKTIYVPVIMVDGQLKPVEMFYYKELNVFLPLDKAWIDEIAKMSVEPMGDSAKIPEDVPRDMSVRRLVLPPVTQSMPFGGGRTGYASANEDIDHGAKKMFKEASYHRLDSTTHFLSVMRHSPKYVLDGVKLAFERNPRLLQKFAKNYGIDPLMKAMSKGYERAKAAQGAQEKIAALQVAKSFNVYTDDTPTTVLKEAFGKEASVAYANIKKHGFVIRDTRGPLNKIAVKTEHPTWLEEPGSEGGWFRLYFVDGPADYYYMVPFPINNDGEVCSIADYSHHKRHPIPYLCIKKDGKEAWVDSSMMGERLYSLDDVKDTKMYKLLNEDGPGDTPGVDSYGFFIHKGTGVPQATGMLRIKFAIKDGDRTKYIANYNDTFIIDDDPSRKHIEELSRGSLTFLPKDTKWVEIGKYSDKDNPRYPGFEAYHTNRKISVIKDPRVMTRWLNAKLQRAEAQPVDVKKAAFNEWWINGSSHAYNTVDALKKVAELYNIPARDAAGILADAQRSGVTNTYILDGPTSVKLAAELFKVAQPPMQQGGAPMPMDMQQQQQMPMDPQGAQGGAQPIGMPPEMPGMQQPPQVNPTNLAIGEAVEELTQQNEMEMQQIQSQAQQAQQAMEMQTQSTQQLIDVLQGIQQRSDEISQATQGGATLPPEAESAPGAAAAMVAPRMPEPEPPPPTPVLEDEVPSPENVADQINPEMVDQVEGLQDQGTFDTAALSMLSSAPVLQDIISTYVPNMEKALDNVGRVLLTLWITEIDTKEQIGDETYIMLENKLRTVFKTLGDVILSLSHNAVTSTDNQSQLADQRMP